MDNYSMWERNEREMEKRLARRPVCCQCGEHIQDEFAYRINDDLFCQDCLEACFQVYVEDYCYGRD